MDKIEELKKLLWILDSKHNVSIPQTKENIDYIAQEIVKLFCQPDVITRCVCGRKPEHKVTIGGFDYYHVIMCECGMNSRFEFSDMWGGTILCAHKSKDEAIKAWNAKVLSDGNAL